ncbi:MAG: 3-oxoacyl-ACP reductase FabG [Chloroflexi bacterium]|nr:3-oxoacyl-ACP reductase FabG [Chloroflexota bacterium]
MAGLLDGQVALVTGASRGIGRAIALELARHGAAIGVNYNQQKEKAEEVAAEIVKGGGKALVVQANVANPEQASALVDRVVKELGPIRILVNNAGTAAPRTLRRMSLEEWRTVIDTNLNGTFYVTSNAVNSMVEAGGGHIVVLSSIIGEEGGVGLINYGTTKAALIGFVKTAARELARYKINVNAVAPGWIDTDMTSVLTPEQRKEIIDDTLLGRFGKPEEVASLVRYLVTEGTFITGAVFDVNGGLRL